MRGFIARMLCWVLKKIGKQPTVTMTGCSIDILPPRHIGFEAKNGVLLKLNNCWVDPEPDKPMSKENRNTRRRWLRKWRKDAPNILAEEAKHDR